MPDSVKLNIYGRSYSVKSDAFSVDPQQVAAMVDAKMKELSGAGGINSTSDLAILTALNIAHELLDNKQKAGENSQIHDSQIDTLIQTLEKGLRT